MRKVVVLFFLILGGVTILVCPSVWASGASETEGESMDSSVQPAESAGIDGNALSENLEAVMREFIDDEYLPGGIVLVARHGNVVYHEAFGKAKEGVPMTLDHQFRWWSITKAVTAVAALQLVDQGLITLQDPIKWHLPEWNQPLEVGIFDEEGILVETRPATGDISVHHLLSMGSGMIGQVQPQEYLIKERGLHILDDSDDPKPLSEYSRVMASTPLLFDPGDGFVYSDYAYGAVLGHLIETVSGQSLGEYFQEHIFEPLGMESVAFGIPAGYTAADFADLYHGSDAFPGSTGKGELFTTSPEAFGGDSLVTYIDADPPLELGSGGLNGRSVDYFPLAQMLLDGGVYNGQRILSERMVALMTTPQNSHGPGGGHEWGYGVAVQVAAVPGTSQVDKGAPGSFGWFGAFGCQFIVNPANDTVVVFMTQVWLSGELNNTLIPRIANSVEGAILE